jgi:2-polyprenyl-3-methyl-5-hydroxy-6-metoxy-1,4-benzoquinol methylase
MDLGSGAVQLPACDYALLCEIIEHVPDAEALLAAARRAARRGVFVSVPNTGFFTYRLRLLFGKFPAQWAVRPNEHLRFWTLTDMRWWLRAQGIHDATVHAYEGVPLLKHLVPNLFAAGIIMYIPTHV